MLSVSSGTRVNKRDDLYIQMRANASGSICSFVSDNKVVFFNDSKSILVSKYILTGTFCSIAHIKSWVEITCCLK